ncbi:MULTISPECIES: addiction module protein [Thiorhodovibrio]|uniref:addiction module protein n=1 Tax=Thiorhodovibrio TaxID=61593 RepID=UPI001914D5C7|nr:MULTISPECIES: addiction module protein [Thiorhodovibrio]MBK5968534.1 addiction module antitoxin RelB [Thiorhodovibrio winogradskyi]WPL12432.1 putative addiction module component [Thiorhodovibrio litoralis]
MMPSLNLSDMSTKEKLQMMEALWDSLTEDSTGPPSPDWHSDVLEERQRKIEAGKGVFLSLDELKAKRPS